MTRIDNSPSKSALSLFILISAVRNIQAEPVSGIASPTVTQTLGNVIITYGNITITRKQQGTHGPNLRQIQVAVQTVLERSMTRSNDEIKSLIEQQLDILDSITMELARMRTELAELDISTSTHYQHLAKKLDAINRLLEEGRTEEAKIDLASVHDIAKSRTMTALRAAAHASIRGNSARVFTGTFLQTFELTISPKDTGSSSLAVGYGVKIGGGSTRGGYASPDPEHRIVDPIVYSSVRGALLGIASLCFRRDRRVRILTSLELEFGGVYYNNIGNSNIPDLRTYIHELHLLNGVATRELLHGYLIAVQIDVALDPWARRPLFPYSGFGASYSDPHTFGEIDVGLAISIISH